MHVGGPLVKGRVFASAEVLKGVADGYVQDLLHPENPLGGNDVTAARTTLRLVFSPRSEFRLTGDYSHRNPAPLFFTKVLAVKPGFAVANPSDPLEVRTSTPASGRHVQYGVLGHFTWRPRRAVVLTSLTAYRDLDYRFKVDSDITELAIVKTGIHETHHQLSQEVTVAGDSPMLRWTAGVIYFTDVDRQPTVTTFLMPRQASTLNPIVNGTSTAAFGQVRLQLPARLAALAGLRYSRDRKTMDNSGGVSLDDVAVSSFEYRDTTTTRAWTPKLGIEYRLSERSMAYAAATRGFKTGGFNLTATRASDGFAPEWVWSYEVGLKAASANARSNVGVSAYVADYTDLQVQTSIRPGLLEITNAADATIRGLEIEATSRLGAGWQAGGHVAWLDATYDRYLAVNADGSTIDVSGRRLSNAPEWSGRVWLEHSGRVWRSGVVSHLEWLPQSTTFFTPVNDAIQRQRPYGLMAASVTVQPSTWWSIGVYGRNLTAADYITGTNSAPPPAIGARPGEPRQVGVQFNIIR